MGAATSISESIRDSILRGELEPGERLRQDVLAGRLGVSKIPVREALQRLAAEGLLAFEANRGFSVQAVEADEAAEIYGLRRAVEPVLLERAIPRLSIVDLARAELALQGTGAPEPARNWGFHEALYQPSGWMRGLALVASLHAAVGPYLALYTARPEARERSEAQHGLLLAHCRAGRIDEAVAVLHEHLDEAAEALMRLLAG